MRAAAAALGTALLAAFPALPAAALDAFEIQVYGPDMNKAGEAGLETHMNMVPSGAKDTGTAVIPPHHQAHLTFEPSYGLTPWWELGGYLQFAYVPEALRDQDPRDRFFWAGVKLRSKLMPERPAGQVFFYGLNLEVSDVPPGFEEHRWASEVRPILGLERGPWYLSVNPILGWELSGPAVSGYPSFEPCAKLRWDTRLGYGVGLEYYMGLGRLDRLEPPRRQEQVLYAAWDLLGKPLELNLGVGRGLTPASDAWTLKAIVGFPF